MGNGNNSKWSEVSTQTQTEKYGFTHIPHVLIKRRSCSPYRVAFHRWLSDCQTWISILKRTQSSYKSADLPDFIYLVQKFTSALYLRPSSLAVSLRSWYTSNMDFYSPKLNTTNALPVLANCTPSMALMCNPQKMVTRCWIVVADTFTNSHKSKLPCLQHKPIPSFRSSTSAV